MWFLFGFITISLCVTFEFWRRHLSRWKPEGVSLGLQYRHVRTKKKIKTLLLGINCHVSPNFYLKRQTGLDNFFKRIGISNELETGDEAFDDAIYLVSDNKTLNYALVNSSEFRTAVKKIMDYGTPSTLEARNIYCRNGRLWVQFGVGDAYDDLHVGNIAKALSSQFDILKKSVNEVALISGSRWRDPFVIKAAILLAMSSGLAINGAIQVFRATMGTIPFTLHHSLIIQDAIKFGLIILIVFMLGALFWLGKSARTHFVLIELATVGAFGIFVTTMVELRDFNMEMDTNAPHYFDTQVVDKYSRRGSRSGRRHYVILRDWNCDCGNYKLQVSRSLYNYLPSRGEVTITQYPGRLGYPWVSSIAAR